MIFCKTLNKSFEDQKTMFKELFERKDEIISLKKAAIKTADGVSLNQMKGEASKAAGDQERVLQFGDIVSNVINTTNYLDSHDDVHLPGIWDKSAAEQSGKTYHVANHDLKVGSVVGYPSEVTIEVKQMGWRDLGLNADGVTEALVFNTKMTDKTNKDVFMAYRDKAPVQHSIRMQYVTIGFACNDPEMKEPFALYNTWLSSIVNKEKAIEQGYFFPVSEAKIYKEGSTVIEGSNDLTPSLGFKEDTQTEPLKSTPEEPFDFVAMCKDFKL